MSESVVVPRRFNGPLESGNGGYSSGLVAGFVGGTAEVSLRSPVPLDTRLDVVRSGDGSVQLVDGETLVATGRPVYDLNLELPEPVGLQEARQAAEAYRGLDEGPFSRCFVCGRARVDAFGVFAGAVSDRQIVASPWIPPLWTAGPTGAVRPELVWAVLDCPTYFATYMNSELGGGVLAGLTAQLSAPIAPGQEYVVSAWPIETEGRKRRAGAAVLSLTGEPLAFGRALLIEPRSG